MINVSEIVNDPDFAQSFNVLRSTVTFVSGGISNAITTVPMWGVILIAEPKDLATLPEGDRISGSMAFYTQLPMYMTNVEGTGDGHLSDIAVWHGQQFRIAKDSIWSDFGYYLTIGVRMSGA